MTRACFLLALALGGCDPNASATPCDAGGPTLMSQCQAVYTTFCQQASRCNTTASATCAADLTAMYCPCSAENCDAGSCSTADLVSTCQQDLQAEDCNAVVNIANASYWPADCQAFRGQN